MQAELGSSTYFVSPDLNYILVAEERTRVWRHSYTARYIIYNVTETDPERCCSFKNQEYMYKPL